MNSLPKVKNNIFISYAGIDRNFSQELCNKINQQLAEHYHAELVENSREGDTTFTEKVINYFKKCNVFIVILTHNSINNQFVNQEWGYAKALKELGQIQIIQHITERTCNKKISSKFDKDSRRIKSRGFIANNMEFIDLPCKNDKYDSEPCIMDVLSFLREKQRTLTGIMTEIQEKLSKFNSENSSNLMLTDKLIQGKWHYLPQHILERKLELARQQNPAWLTYSNEELAEIQRGGMYIDKDEFTYNFALQIMNLSHLLINKDFSNKIVEYINIGRKLNLQKNFCQTWIVARPTQPPNPSEANNYYTLLDQVRKYCQEMQTLILQELTRFN